MEEEVSRCGVCEVSGKGEGGVIGCGVGVVCGG